jgi:hypothetical protein
MRVLHFIVSVFSSFGVNAVQFPEVENVYSIIMSSSSKYEGSFVIAFSSVQILLQHAFSLSDSAQSRWGESSTYRKPMECPLYRKSSAPTPSQPLRSGRRFPVSYLNASCSYSWKTYLVEWVHAGIAERGWVLAGISEGVNTCWDSRKGAGTCWDSRKGVYCAFSLIKTLKKLRDL